MVTDLAPVDLIIQRAGRLRRHNRTESGDLKLKGPDERGQSNLKIFGPSLDQKIESNWYSSFSRGSAFVYPDHGVVWKTASVIKQKETLSLPQDSRVLIEEVFGENNNEIPENLEALTFKEHGRQSAHQQMAQFNSINLNQGYSREGFDWWDDAFTPTRLGEPSQGVQLVTIKNNKIHPLYDEDRLPSLSQLNLLQSHALKSLTTVKKRKKS